MTSNASFQQACESVADLLNELHNPLNEDQGVTLMKFSSLFQDSPQETAAIFSGGLITYLARQQSAIKADLERQIWFAQSSSEGFH